MDRALLVGINTYAEAPLRGCVNDVEDMATYLYQQGFLSENICVLTNLQATAQALRENLRRLVNELRENDRALFHYSGHGTQIPVQDKTGEFVALNEVICPVDFDWTSEKTIGDQEFHQIFSAVPPGANFIWTSDSCHSGDLDRDTEERDSPRQLAQPHDLAWCSLAAKTNKCGGPPNPPENFILAAACTSNQVASDTVINNRPNGAFTYYLLETLRDQPEIPVAAIVIEVRKRLRAAGYKQEPQLRGSPALARRGFLTSTQK